MKTVFKAIVCIVFLIPCGNTAMAFKFRSEKYRYGFDFLEMDSIEIKTINPTAVGFGPIIYDREHFDDVFDFFLVHPERQTDVYRFVVTSPKEMMFISAAMESFVPYEEEHIKVYPDDVKIKDGIDWRDHLHSEWQTNDPIETRTRIRFYMKDGDVITAFASPTSFDIFNYRYASPQFSSIMVNYIWYFFDEAEGVVSNYDILNKLLEERYR